MAFPETQIPSFLIAEAGTGVGMLLWAVFGHTAKEHRALFCGSQCCQRVSGTMDCLQIITRHKGKLLAFINKKFPLYQALFQKGKGRNWHYVKVLPCQNRLPLLLIWNCFICDPWSLLVACISGYCDLIPMTLPNLQTSYHISSNCSFLFYFAGCTVNYFFNGLGVCMCSPSLSLSLSLSLLEMCAHSVTYWWHPVHYFLLIHGICKHWRNGHIWLQVLCAAISFYSPSGYPVSKM